MAVQLVQLRFKGVVKLLLSRLRAEKFKLRTTLESKSKMGVSRSNRCQREIFGRSRSVIFIYQLADLVS